MLSTVCKDAVAGYCVLYARFHGAVGVLCAGSCGQECCMLGTVSRGIVAEYLCCVGDTMCYGAGYSVLRFVC